MSLKKRWFVPALFLGAALACSIYRRRDLECLPNNMRRYSAPNAGLYDAVVTPMLGGFFADVAREAAGLGLAGPVLEVGSGPGRLALKLAGLGPEVRVTGVDISPDMVKRARGLAARFGLADRV